ncbi:MAG: hypothetical protein KGJ86_16765, partial [Chloroflexota bacterium]|nr:hypothetical protein [Chloroflexota bacterium]
LIAVGSDGLWRSADDGKTWSRGPAAPGPVLTLTANPSAGEGLFAGGNGFLGQSEDAGLNWRWITPTPANLDFRALGFDPRSERLVAYAGQAGLIASQDGGQNWQRVARDVPGSVASFASYISTITMAGMNMPPGPILFAALPGIGVVASANGGQHWQDASGSVNLTLPTTQIGSLATDGRVLYVATDQGVYASNDDGRGWFSTNRNFKLPLAVVGATAGQKGLVVAITRDGQVFVSRDAGSSWRG